MPGRREQLGTWLGVAYILLMACHVPLCCGKAFAEDLCVPFMVLLLLPEARRDSWKAFPFLFAFLAFSLGMTLLHACGLSLPLAVHECFEWTIFAYGAVVFLFFCTYRLPVRQLAILAAVLLAAFSATWLFDCLRWLADHASLPCFGMVYSQMDSTEMAFLARRFCFTFGNPNLAGSFLALPMAMATIAIEQKQLRRLLHCLVVLAFLPLFFTMSKHGILCLACFSAICSRIPAIPPRFASKLYLPVLAAGLLFETTVLFTTFPVTGKPPFLNTTPGMYTIHQRAYLKIATSSPSAFLFGTGTEKAKELYPKYVDRQSAAKTLACYNASKDLDSFCAFMDPHQEFLNQITLFGGPALLLLLAHLASVGQTNRLAAFFLLALLFSMLWDDILSKRWLWTTLALCSTSIPAKNSRNSPRNIQSHE